MDTKLACLTTSIGSSIQGRSLFRGYCCWITDKRNKAPASTASSRPGPPSRLGGYQVAADSSQYLSKIEPFRGASPATRTHRVSTPVNKETDRQASARRKSLVNLARRAFMSRLPFRTHTRARSARASSLWFQARAAVRRGIRLRRCPNTARKSAWDRAQRSGRGT